MDLRNSRIAKHQNYTYDNNNSLAGHFDPSNPLFTLPHPVLCPWYLRATLVGFLTLVSDRLSQWGHQENTRGRDHGRGAHSSSCLSESLPPSCYIPRPKVTAPVRQPSPSLDFSHHSCPCPFRTRHGKAFHSSLFSSPSFH